MVNHALPKAAAPFRKAIVRSKIVGFDEKFYYFQQTIEQKGEVKSSALIRAGIRFKGGSAPPREIMSDLGYELEPFMEPWVVEWAEWDNEHHGLNQYDFPSRGSVCIDPLNPLCIGK